MRRHKAAIAAEESEDSHRAVSSCKKQRINPRYICLVVEGGLVVFRGESGGLFCFEGDITDA
jgi:hypothetical protein